MALRLVDPYQLGLQLGVYYVLSVELTSCRRRPNFYQNEGPLLSQLVKLIPRAK
jgi:hypothetical protein